jgi:hypothetical protein
VSRDGPPAAPPTDVVAHAREVLAQAHYQTELPDGSPFELPFSLVSGVELFVWLALAAAVVVAVAWIVGRIRRDDRYVAGARVATDAAPEAAGTSTEEIDRIAAEGRYAEAVHGLLQAAIERETRRLDRPPRPSATSRELARTLPLDGRRRAAFRSIVEHVERSLFGGEAVSEAQYRLCRDRFDELAGSRG